jgi:DNA-binding winged helix-turn-helix (wHTH) protein/tetratricopeptide (TPR) repeat protein
MDLAHQPALRLGAVDVRPSTREIVFAGGREVIEPRVMAVLVVLAKAGGEVVTRDELIDACWDGRAVSEDAVNRVISRIRRLSELTARQDFTLETITKVGYRLVASGARAAAAFQPIGAAGDTKDSASPKGAGFRIDRRLLLASAVGVVAIGGGLAWRLTRAQPQPSRADELYRRAVEVGATDNAADIAQSISFLREAVELAPNHADAWAALALAYVYSLSTNPSEKHAALADRARDAANRALSFDQNSADALGALAMLPPIYQRWAEAEASFRGVLARRPKLAPIDCAIADLLGATGRLQESIPPSERAVAHTPLIARRQYELAMRYWYAGRLADAERTIEKAYDLWPLDISVWFGRLYMRMHGGDIRGSLDMLADTTSRPPGIPPSDYALVETGARALQSSIATDRARAIDSNLAAAGEGLGYARNAVIVAAVLGDLDAAFEAINAYYFDTPFAVAQTYFTPQQGDYLGVRSRETQFLFAPQLKAMREDSRFEKLVSDVGLDDYWRSAGVAPDYRSPSR